MRQSYFLWSNKKLVFYSFAIIFISSCSFGLWFKIKQISIASEKILGLYPLIGYAVSSLKTLFIFSTLWLALALLKGKISGDLDRTGLARNLFICSLPFAAFSLSSLNVSISLQALLFVLFCVTLLLFSFQHTSFWMSTKEPICVLAFYFLCFFLILKSYSPLFHNTFWDTWGLGNFLINLEHQWENAKAYDFLGNFTQSRALGGHPQGIYMISELSAILILIFDLPIIDLFGKYASVKFLFLGFYIFGSFGTYLFFRYGLKLSNQISTIGGLGFFWGNSPYLSLMAGEFPIHMVQFTFFPWVLLLIKLAYSLNKPALSCLAGLVASLSEYAMSSHPESDFIYFIFCNIYNLYLALTQIAKSGLQMASIKRFCGWVVILPVFWAIGLAYRIIPMIGAILNKEYAVADSVTGLGLWWGSGENSLQRFSTMFFRFEDQTKTSPLFMGGGEFTTGWPVYFFIGQPLLFFAFAFVCLTFVTIYKKALHKPNQYLQYTHLKASLFFVVIYLFLSLNLPQGNVSWLHEFMVWTGFLRIHNAFRLTTYYFFFGLVVAMYGLNFLLHIKKIFTLNIIFLSFLAMLAVVCISPLYLAKPDQIFLDGVLFFLGYLLVLGYILTSQNKKSQRLQFLPSIKTSQIKKIFSPLMNASNLRNTIGILMLGLIFFSFINLNSIIKSFLLTQNNLGLKETNTYNPTRVSITQLKNNQHDMASFVFLEKEIERFAYDLSSKRKKNLVRRIYEVDSLLATLPSCIRPDVFNKEADEKYNQISKKLSKYMYLDPGLESLRKILLLKEKKLKQSKSMCRDALLQPLTTMLKKSESLKTLKSENGFLDSWAPKNTSYLIKRSLDIFLDPIWRHKSILNFKNNTKTKILSTAFIQRRFHQKLNNVEAIDLVFSPEVSKKLIKYDSLPNNVGEVGWKHDVLLVNLRLSGSALSGIEHILPAYFLPTEIIEGKKKKISLRIHIGPMIRNKNYFPFKKGSYLYFNYLPGVNSDRNIFLKEIILLIPPDYQNDLFKTLPLKRIDFLGLKNSLPLTDTSVFVVPDDQSFKNIVRDFLVRRVINPLDSFVDRMTEFKPSWKPSWESLGKYMEFFNEIAPERDNFYYLDDPTNIIMHTPDSYHGPLKYNINNIPLFYLPDEYQLFIFLSPFDNGSSMSVGKKSVFKAGMYFGLGPTYPSINVGFHLESLFYKPGEIKGDNPSQLGLDWTVYGVEFDHILENPNGKKILDILGVDFLVFQKSFLNNVPSSSFYFPNPKMPTPSEKMEGFLSMGLIPFDLPESYKTAPRFPDHYGVHVLKNPESYGKAFLAKWVKTIKPNENYFNKNIFELGMNWPRSRKLQKHFDQHLSKIPDIQGATLIESNNTEDFKINPREYQSNSSIDIVKIIASKAVFNVDCKDDHCWLVHNTAALNGWKAYSGSEKLQIHKANLGFVGVKLDRGQHFIWMEYQPWLPTIGLLIALSGWIFTFTQLIVRRKFNF